MNRISEGAKTVAPIMVAPQTEFRILSKEGPETLKMLALITATGAIALPAAWWAVLSALSHFPFIAHLIGHMIDPIIQAIKTDERLRSVIQNPGSWAVSIGLLGTLANRLFTPPPTHLMILPEGLIAFRARPDSVTQFNHPDLATGWGRTSSRFNVLARIKWAQVRRIALNQTSMNRGAQIVCFHLDTGKIVKIRLGDVLTQEVRTRLLATLAECAPDVQVQSEVYDLLEPRPETSFTDLWISALSAPPARERIASLAKGTEVNLGRYKIIELLGSGGQGTIYVANDLENKSSGTVVIKEYVLPIHVTRDAKKSAIESLEHEVLLLKKLDNPHIVKVLDFFIEDHRGYLVFEHLHGENLRNVVARSGPFEQDKACQILSQMIEILSYLHAQEPPLVHRDFTPDNLIMDDVTGQIKLIDFNVAQTTTDTINAIVVGKRSYMPPEQFRGEAVPQSDIYAFGACAYFLLTGEEPEPLSVLKPRERNSSVSEALNNLVAKCTQLDVESRYRHASEIAERL